MSRLILVRHGRAAAGWGDDADPGLDPEGRGQAEAMAAELSGAGPLTLLCSPLARTRQTAAALEAAWGVTAVVEPRVGEIPTPPGVSLDERGAWLAGVMASRWDDPSLPELLTRWRSDLVDALLAVAGDAVVVTHFIATNVAVGEATGDQRVVCFRPGYCSRTVLGTDGGRLQVMSLGDESATVVR